MTHIFKQVRHISGMTSRDLNLNIAAMVARLPGAGSLASATWVPAGLGAAGTVAAGTMAGLPTLAVVLGGLYSIGRAGERGEVLAQYNAFITAFAQSVSDFSRGLDRRRRNVAYPDASIKGRNAAIDFLTSLGAERRNDVFRALRNMSDGRVVAGIQAELGGLRTR